MINTEMVENPVLEELDSSVPLLDEVAGTRGSQRREAARTCKEKEEAWRRRRKKDPFDEIDFGSFFRDYLDPGYRSSADMEEIDRPSFENFLSKPELSPTIYVATGLQSHVRRQYALQQSWSSAI